ncbi:hypothetical protein BDU57DRAFT_511267 [Ampelomyces quisqualis]|uniref:Uncharacterized protein n=1 Tax=Ampelomyces quisqualis TaxID=50730 RepID=A0A6A5R212_AMPQU|nr:hypothetical protein BDU57DRAFT_511267 [Ampelomyces quisqualis]
MQDIVTLSPTRTSFSISTISTIFPTQQAEQDNQVGREIWQSYFHETTFTSVDALKCVHCTYLLSQARDWYSGVPPPELRAEVLEHVEVHSDDWWPADVEFSMFAAQLQFSLQLQYLDELERNDGMDDDMPDIELGDLIDLTALAREAMVEELEDMLGAQSEQCADPAPLGVSRFYGIECKPKDHGAQPERYLRSAYPEDEEPVFRDQRIDEWLRAVCSD